MLNIFEKKDKQNICSAKWVSLVFAALLTQIQVGQENTYF